MKCKKILAMLLALCMVLTTFVAVSAEDVVVIDINEDYETDIGDTICGGDISLDTVEFEGENVLKVTSSYSGAAGWQSIVGFAVKDTEGTHLKQSEWLTEGTIEYSFDIFVPEEGGNTGDLTVYLRTGNAFPPSGNMDEFDPVNGLVKGEWNTYSGSLDATDIVFTQDTSSDSPIWIGFRPNFSAVGTFYIDNFSFKVTQTVEEEEPEYYNVIDFEAAIDDASEITHTGANVSVENADGIGGRDNVVKATGVDSTNNGTAGVKFGGADFKFEVGDIITYSFDYYAEEASNPCIWLRKHTPTLTPFRGYTDTFNVEANTWTTLTKTLTVTDDTTFWSDTANFADAGQFAIYVRGGAATCYLDNISVTVQREGTAPDEGGDEPGGDIGGGDDPIIPSDEITFTLERAVNAGTNNGNAYPAVGELNDDVFTATLANVRNYTVSRNGDDEANYGGDCGYQPWVWIMLDEEIDTDEDWYVSFDLTTEGIINSLGAEYETLNEGIRVRFYNDNTEVNTSYRPNQVVTVNTGEAVNVGCQVDTAQLSGPVNKIGLVVNVGSSVKYNDYEGSDAYFEISNIEVAMGEYVAPEQGGDEPGGDEPELPPVEDDSIAFTAEATSGWIEASDGSFTFTAADVYENMTVDTANPYTGFVKIVLDTPIAKTAEWTLTYDLTTSGVVDPDNQDDTWARLLDNTTTATQGKTVGYVKQVSSFEDGTRTVTFTSDLIEAGGGTSTATEIAAINLTVDMTQVRAAYGEAANDGVFTISNITLVSGLPSEEPEEPEDPEVPEDPEIPGDEPTDELTYVPVVDIANDFETAIDPVQVGTTGVAGEIVDLDGNKVLMVTSEGSTTHNGLISIQLKDAEGNAFKHTDYADYDKITWSVDIMLPDATKLPSGNGATVNARYGGWTPTSAMANLSVFGSNSVTSGQWKTLSGTKNIGDIPWQATNFDGDLWVNIRPNFTGAAVMYVDNFTVKVEKEFVPTILEVTEVETGADNVVLNVETDGIIDIESLADYILIDGAAVNTENVSVEAVDANNTTVTIIGLAPGTEYEIAVTGAMNSRDREVTVANEADCTVSVTTVAEVDVEAGISNDTLTFSLTNNLSETETIHVVLLRCKGNTVIETIATEIEAAPGEPIEDSLEVTELGAGEYYRVFAWTYEDGAINSMANLIDLD